MCRVFICVEEDRACSLLKEAYKLARQKTVGSGHRKGVRQAERDREHRVAEAGGQWGDREVGLLEAATQGQARGVESCQLLLGRQAFTGLPSSRCRPAVACHRSPKTCVQPFCSHPDSCPLPTCRLGILVPKPLCLALDLGCCYAPRPAASKYSSWASACP